MSIQEVERVMHRALSDEAFRELLSANPGAALVQYELTAEERALILGMSSSATAPGPEERP
jgi:hypothetical protein